MIIGIISPYSGDVQRNTAFLHAIIKSILAEGHTPIAGHALYPQVLDDTDPEQRAQGIAAGQRLLAKCDAVRVYDQLGMSAGMRADLEFCGANQVPFKFARLDGWECRQTTSDDLPALPDGWKWVSQYEAIGGRGACTASIAKVGAQFVATMRRHAGYSRCGLRNTLREAQVAVVEWAIAAAK